MDRSAGLVEWVCAQWKGSRKLRFLVVGAYNTAFGYAAFAILYLLAGERVSYLILLVIAHFLAVTNAFLGHRNVTFIATGSVWRQYLRFNVSYLGLLLLGLILMSLSVRVLGLHPLVASAFVVAITAVTGYSVHRTYTFGRGRDGVE